MDLDGGRRTRRASPGHGCEPCSLAGSALHRRGSGDLHVRRRRRHHGQPCRPAAGRRRDCRRRRLPSVETADRSDRSERLLTSVPRREHGRGRPRARLPLPADSLHGGSRPDGIFHSAVERVGGAPFVLDGVPRRGRRRPTHNERLRYGSLRGARRRSKQTEEATDDRDLSRRSGPVPAAISARAALSRSSRQDFFDCDRRGSG